MSEIFAEEISKLKTKIEELQQYPQRIENENGTAIKFADGTMICIQAKNITTTITNKQTIVYSSPLITLSDFPIPFFNIPFVQMSINDEESNWFCWLRRRGKATRTNPGGCILIRDSSTTENGKVLTSIHVTAIGRWK